MTHGLRRLFRFASIGVVVTSLLNAMAWGQVVPGQCGEDGSTICSFEIRGELDTKKLNALRSFMTTGPKDRFRFIHLDSPGGDVDIAMAMGRLIREDDHAYTVVKDQASCASSCVFVLIGGTHRIIGGFVGIHSPYSTGTQDSTAADHRARFARMDASIRRYLQEMNIPVALFDEMLRYNPEDLHLLTGTEQSRFRLNETDYVTQDRDNSRMARRLGIEKAAYLARMARAKTDCPLSNYAVNLPNRDLLALNCTLQTVYGPDYEAFFAKKWPDSK